MSIFPPRMLVVTDLRSIKKRVDQFFVDRKIEFDLYFLEKLPSALIFAEFGGVDFIAICLGSKSQARVVMEEIRRNKKLDAIPLYLIGDIGSFGLLELNPMRDHRFPCLDLWLESMATPASGSAVDA